MNRLQLIELLSESDEEEVYIVDDYGVERDITLEHAEETFDGFYTAFPAHVNLKMTDL